jgi:hypothetical protein
MIYVRILLLLFIGKKNIVNNIKGIHINFLEFPPDLTNSTPPLTDFMV